MNGDLVMEGVWSVLGAGSSLAFVLTGVVVKLLTEAERTGVEVFTAVGVFVIGGAALVVFDDLGLVTLLELGGGTATFTGTTAGFETALPNKADRAATDCALRRCSCCSIAAARSAASAASFSARARASCSWARRALASSSCCCFSATSLSASFMWRLPAATVVDVVVVVMVGAGAREPIAPLRARPTAGEDAAPTTAAGVLAAAVAE